MRLLVLFLLSIFFTSCEQSTVELGGELQNLVANEALEDIPEDHEDEDVVDDDPEETPSVACNKSTNLSNIEKPKGVFTSVLTSGAVTNNTIKGGLIRVTWAELEPSPGVFNYDKIEDQLSRLPSGKKWSLAVHGGYLGVDENDPDLYDGSTYPNGQPRTTVSTSMSPSWLKDTYSVSTFEMEFRSVTVYMPKYWDTKLQERLSLMLSEVANRYKNDTKLQLVYVPQMTSNGVEGHFNGVDYNILIDAAGVDRNALDAYEQFEDIWSHAAKLATLSVISAFPNQAVAFEVHELLGRINAAEIITQNFLDDSSFQNRAGAAIWWLSEDYDYQPALLEYLKTYTGDLYGQVIANSSQTDRIAAGKYPEVFTVAKELCMRYVEPWNYEFENNTYDDAMRDFNSFADETFN